MNIVPAYRDPIAGDGPPQLPIDWWFKRHHLPNHNAIVSTNSECNKEPNYGRNGVRNRLFVSICCVGSFRSFLPNVFSFLF
nr:unnamed protein product [Haemonchus contortus]